MKTDAPRPPSGSLIILSRNGRLSVPDGLHYWRAPAASVRIEVRDNRVRTAGHFGRVRTAGDLALLLTDDHGASVVRPVKAKCADAVLLWVAALEKWQAAQLSDAS